MTKLYRHYKGNLYGYVGECRHSETLEEMVRCSSSGRAVRELSEACANLISKS